MRVQKISHLFPLSSKERHELWLQSKTLRGTAKDLTEEKAAGQNAPTHKS